TRVDEVAAVDARVALTLAFSFSFSFALTFALTFAFAFALTLAFSFSLALTCRRGARVDVRARLARRTGREKVFDARAAQQVRGEDQHGHEGDEGAQHLMLAHPFVDPPGALDEQVGGRHTDLVGALDAALDEVGGAVRPIERVVHGVGAAQL